MKKSEDNIYFHYANSIDSSFIYKKLGLNFSTDIFYICDEDGEYFYVPIFEYDYLKKYSKHKGIRSIKGNFELKKNSFNVIIDLLERKEKAIKVPAKFPSWLLQKMINIGLDVKVDDYYYFRTLLYKNDEEVGMIRNSATGVRECFQYIKNVLSLTKHKKGFIYFKNRKLSTNILSSMIRLFLLERNMYSEFISIACGKFSYYPHYQIDHFLEANEPIIIDLVAKDINNGYCIDVSRTYSIGNPKHENFINLYNNIQKVKSILEKNIRPNESIAKAYIEAEKIMLENGIIMTKDEVSKINDKDTYICHHSLGHGIGREMHELPIINENANVDFEKNMVIAIEPGAYLKDVGGVRIEDTYLVTDLGFENLTIGNYNFLINII